MRGGTLCRIVVGTLVLVGLAGPTVSVAAECDLSSYDGWTVITDNAGFDALNSPDPPGCVYIAPKNGAYVVNNPIVISSSLYLHGSDQYSTNLRAADPSVPLFRVVDGSGGTSRINMAGFRFRPTGATYYPTRTRAISFENTQAVTFEMLDTFVDRSHYLYAEYGLVSGVTVVALVPFKKLTVRDGGGERTTSSIGSVMIGTRLGLNGALGLGESANALAANVMLTLPAGYERNAAPSVGPGQADVQATFSYGRSLYPAPAYFQAAAGFRYRSDLFALSSVADCDPTMSTTCVEDVQPNYDNEWLLNAEFGASISSYVLVQLLAQGVFSNNPPTEGFAAANPNALRQRFSKVGVGVTVYPIRFIGVSVQYFGTVSGKNTVASNDYFLGIEYLLRSQ